jgi:hypothetical protein
LRAWLKYLIAIRFFGYPISYKNKSTIILGFSEEFLGSFAILSRVDCFTIGAGAQRPTRQKFINIAAKAAKAKIKTFFRILAIMVLYHILVFLC